MLGRLAISSLFSYYRYRLHIVPFTHARIHSLSPAYHMVFEFLSSLNNNEVAIVPSHEKTFADFSNDPNYEGSQLRILAEGAPLVCFAHNKQKYDNMTWTEWFNPLRDMEYGRYLLFCLTMWISYRILRRLLAYLIICIWKLSRPVHTRMYVSTNEHTTRRFASDSDGPFSASSTENIQSFTTEYRQSHTATRPVTDGVRILSALYILAALFVVTGAGYGLYRLVDYFGLFTSSLLFDKYIFNSNVNVLHVVAGFCAGQFRLLNFCVQAVMNGAANIPKAKSHPRRLSRSPKSKRNQTPDSNSDSEEDEKIITMTKC